LVNDDDLEALEAEVINLNLEKKNCINQDEVVDMANDDIITGEPLFVKRLTGEENEKVDVS